MKHIWALALALLLVTTSNAFANKKGLGASIQPDNYYPRVKFETSMGDITVELNRKRAPITVNNFLRYAKLGQYDNTLFHRVVFEYIVQGGGYSPEFEEKTEFSPIFNESGNGLKNDAYTIAMARMDDQHSAKRQFFFNAKDNDNLNPGKNWGYTVFGLVIDGQSVIDDMALVETEYNVEARFYEVPVKPIVLKKVSILAE